MTRSASSCDGRPVFLGLHDQLVVDVGDVDHPRHLVAEVDEVPLDRVEDHRADHVADVAGRIDRRPADVHADLAGLDRLEGLLGLSQRVIDAQRHGKDITQFSRSSGRRHRSTRSTTIRTSGPARAPDQTTPA